MHIGEIKIENRQCMRHSATIHTPVEDRILSSRHTKFFALDF